MKKMGERNIVLDCSQLGRVSELLHQAQQVGMATLAQSYFITSLVRRANWSDWGNKTVKPVGSPLSLFEFVFLSKLVFKKGVETVDPTVDML